MYTYDMFYFDFRLCLEMGKCAFQGKEKEHKEKSEKDFILDLGKDVIRGA